MPFFVVIFLIKIFFCVHDVIKIFFNLHIHLVEVSNAVSLPAERSLMRKQVGILH